MVSAYAVVIVRSFVLVERVRGKVEHTVTAEVGLVLKDNLVGLSHLYRCLALTLVDKHVIVEVALVDLPHVNKTENYQRSHHVFCLQFLCLIEQQAESADDDDEERAPAVGSEHGDTHLAQIGEQRVKIVGRYLLQCPHLFRRNEV